MVIIKVRGSSVLRVPASNGLLEETEVVEWSIEKARETYNIKQWSEGYFDISEQGQLQAYPKGRAAKHCIDLSELAITAQNSGLSLPLLVRFPDTLRNRVNTLKDAFA